MGLLDGKVAVVTGAGGGLGRCHALALAREGADLVINDIAPAPEGQELRPAEAVCKEIEALGRKAVPHFDDISEPEGAEGLIQLATGQLGRLDVLVNNAGILRDKTLKKLPVEHFDLVLKVHLRGTFLCTKFAALAFAEQKEGGRIVNTTSIAGLKGNFGQANYSSAKAGIYGLTLTSAQELERGGVMVNAIAPIAKTAMTEGLDAVPEDFEPEMVSPLVVYLCSGLSEGVTGRVFGAHGNHYFEYAMKMADGVDKGAEAWSPSEVAEKLGDIGKFESAAAAGGEGPEAELCARVFEHLGEAFLAEKAEGWNTVMHWKVAGAGEWTLVVQDGMFDKAPGLQGTATCVVEVDAATLAGIVDGSVDANAAFMKGKIKASKVPDLGKFGVVFRFDDAFRAKVGVGEAAGGGGGKKGNGLVNPEAVGLKYRGRARLARPDRIQAYAAATNDANPRYQPGEDQAGSPVFPVTYVMDLFEEAMMDPELGIDMGRVVHGEQEITYHQPIRAWDLITPRCQVLGVHEKSSGWLVDIEQKLLCDGELAVEMRAGIFVRGEKKGEGKKAPAEEPARPEPKLTAKLKVDEDQCERYAEASGDHNPIHLDAEFARSVGLPGKILHGLCTMAMSVGALVNEGLDGDPSRLKKVKVRFSKPVLPGDELTVTAWEVSKDDRDVVLGFEVTNPEGAVVLSNGEAHVLD